MRMPLSWLAEYTDLPPGATGADVAAALVSVGLARHLTALRAVRNDRRIVYRDQRRKAPRAAAARIFRVSRVIAEASVVLHVGPRAHATALRLEWAHRHWRATELTVL